MQPQPPWLRAVSLGVWNSPTSERAGGEVTRTRVRVELVELVEMVGMVGLEELEEPSMCFHTASCQFRSLKRRFS